MEQRLNIDAITPEMSDWTCKVQLMDICRPGEGRERKIKYMHMIFQDEQQNRVKAIVYGNGIPLYQHRFKLFHTYLIRSARVQQSALRYERPFHAYEWIIDKLTTVDSIDKDNSDHIIVDPFDPDDLDEDELPPPTIVSMEGDNKRQKKHLLSSGQQTLEPKKKSEVLKLKQKMEPPTPTKMQ